MVTLFKPLPLGRRGRCPCELQLVGIDYRGPEPSMLQPNNWPYHEISICLQVSIPPRAPYPESYEGNEYHLETYAWITWYGALRVHRSNLSR